MKFASLFILGLVLGQSALAGDPGYFSRTCISSTQRTVLTILDDYTADYGRVYTLVMDGAPSVYKLGDPSVKETGDDGVLTIYRNRSEAFRIDYDVNSNSMIVMIYADPRTGTIAENNASPTPIRVQLKCKDFFPNP